MLLKEEKFYKVARLFYEGFGNYKRKIALLATLGFFSGLLDGVGITAVIPFLAILTKTSAASTNVVTAWIEKIFYVFNIDFSLKFLLIFICSLFVLRGLVSVFTSYIRIKITFDYEEQKRSELLKLFLGASWPFLLKQKLGHVETILMTNVRFGNSLLDHLSNVIITLGGLLIYVLLSLNLSPAITLLTIVLGFFLFYFFKPLFANTKIISHSVEEINKKIAHFINENTIGLKALKIMNVSEQILTIGKNYFCSLKDLGVRINLLKSIGNSLMQPLGVIFVSLIFVFSYKTSKNFDMGAMAAIVYLIQRIFIYFQQLQASLNVLSEGAPYLQAIITLENEARQNIEIEQGAAKFSFNKSLVFNDIYFSYGRGKEILSGVNFEIKKGETVGLIGVSGSGKTTLVDLVLRLFRPTEGEILLDGKNIGDIDLTDWRKNCGYVSQDMFLINDTFSNNIRFYNDQVAEDEIKEAAKAANIYEFIESCPNKFETVIGERGVSLSVGQRQRVIIARILARKTPFLIFDEATSALDSESEAQIQEVINRLKGKLTIFIIAHRLSTVINCDNLLVLEKGRIAEQGSPQNLLKNDKSYFFRMYSHQKQK